MGHARGLIGAGPLTATQHEKAGRRKAAHDGNESKTNDEFHGAIMNRDGPLHTIPSRWGGRTWWGLLAAALVVSGITARLGFWQLSRAQQREALHAQEVSRSQLPPLGNADWQPPLPQAEGLQRPVVVTGRWLERYTVYLDNRSLGGQSGFFILTPLQLPEGPVLWVQRGWVARDRVRADYLPPVPTPLGEVRVVGRWVAEPSKLMDLGATAPMPSGFATLRHNIDLNEFRLETGLSIVATVLQTEGSGDGLSREWPRSGSGADKNRAYALQWFALSALSLILFVWFQIWKKKPHG